MTQGTQTLRRGPSAAIPPPRFADQLFASYVRRGWRGRASLWRMLGRNAGDTLRVCTGHGLYLALNPFAYIDGIVIEQGYYESEILEALRPHLRPRAVLWDIGANFGLHAITAARLCPEATVFAFEPNPSEHARLLAHRAWNAPHVLTTTLALSDTDGVLPLHLGPQGNSGMTTLSPWSEARYSGQVLVAVVPGDVLVSSRQVSAPTAIKLDVEGHELAVLRGLRETLRLPQCELIVFEDDISSDSPVKQLLRECGFTIAPLVRRERTAHALMNFAARRSAPNR